MRTLKAIKRFIVGVVGFTVLGIGIVLIVLPGPAFIIIPLGLGILALEFVWARNIIETGKRIYRKKNKGSQNDRHV